MPPHESSVPKPGEPWEGALNEDRAVDPDALRRAAVGKKVKDVRYVEPGTGQELVIEFDDGTMLVLRSWDYEGYSSGIYIHRIP